MPTKKWTKSKISEEIKFLHQKGVPLNSSFIQKNHSGLMSGAKNEYGSWEKAIENAGLNYESIRLQRPPYSDDDILKEIQSIGESDKLNAAYVRDNYSIYSSAVNRFGTWENAVETAGFSYSNILLETKYKNSSIMIRSWSKDDVIAGIMKRLDEGKSIVGSDVEKENNSLYHNAIYLFKKWRTAVEATGYNYCYFEYIPNKKYTKDSIAKELVRLDNQGFDLSHSNIRKSKTELYSAMINRKDTFKSYKEAMEYAGIDIEKHRKGPKPSIYSNMRKQTLIRVIKELHRKGESLNATSIDVNLYNAIRKKFGSWLVGIEATGLDSELIYRNISDEIKRGYQFEKLVEYMFRKLNECYDYHDVFNLENEKGEKITCVPDFSKGTDIWIDAKLHSWTSTIKDTIQKYIPHTNNLTILFLKGNNRHSYNDKLNFIPIDNYYKDLEIAELGFLIEKFELLKERLLNKDEMIK